MKYGAWGKSPMTVKHAAIKKGKRASERKKDLNKLKKAFPDIPLPEIERIYNENNENIDDSTINLSSLSAFNEENKQKAWESSKTQQKPTQSIELLEEMFEGLDNSYIQEVYGQCDEDITQATAFLLETSNEDSLNAEENFGNNSIGYVNKVSLKRRINKSFGEMICEAFPTVDREVTLSVYEDCNHDMIKTFNCLNDLYLVPREENTENEGQGVKKYDEEYPSLEKGPPKSRLVKQGVWAKHSNNYFLDGNNLDEVKKISILKSSFPAIDDIAIKEIYFQIGNLKDTITKLREMFPKNYREIPEELPIFIPYPSNPQTIKTTELENFDIESFEPVKESHYKEALEIMARSKALHDTFFQAASNAAAAGNFLEAKKLTWEGKKHQKIFNDLYKQTFKETFRRNNEKCAADQIDLHGLQSEEALLFLDSFFKKTRQTCRRVEVITVF